MEENKKSDLEKFGISVVRTKIAVQITEEDMLKDLVDKTEGQNIKVEPTNPN